MVGILVGGLVWPRVIEVLILMAHRDFKCLHPLAHECTEIVLMGEVLGQHLRSDLHIYFLCSHENEAKNNPQKLTSARVKYYHHF